jgi:single-strand selective monofunctional uracil DNA glycosylase
MGLNQITDQLTKDMRQLQFGPPVTHVYNPFEYARKPYKLYLKRFASPPKKVVLLGMNPGPWGMAQTGVPFGEVQAVKHWMGIEAKVAVPDNMHPKRPVMGFDCARSEISGKRLWGWAQKKFKTPERFFSRFFVANYCPLQFIEASGRNRTSEPALLYPVLTSRLTRSPIQARPIPRLTVDGKK